MKTDLWCLNDEAVLLLVEPVENLQDCLWVGLHHVDEEVGGLKVAPVGVKDVEGLGLQGLVVVGVAIDVHLQAVLRVNLLYKAGQTLEKNSTLFNLHFHTFQEGHLSLITWLGTKTN